MLRTLLLCVLAVPLCAADFDVLIRNARIVDGTGNPWYRGDIGVKDGKILAIGRLTGTADRTIDAANIRGVGRDKARCAVDAQWKRDCDCRHLARRCADRLGCERQRRIGHRRRCRRSTA